MRPSLVVVSGISDPFSIGRDPGRSVRALAVGQGLDLECRKIHRVYFRVPV